MSDTTFTFRLDEDLKATFSAAAKARDRTAAQYLRVLMREAVTREESRREHDAWFRQEVSQALREAGNPDVGRIPHDEVRSAWRRQRAELARSGDDKLP